MRGTEHLHPTLWAVAERFKAECGARGLPLLITETWRTRAEQDALYAQGRTAPGRIVTNAPYPQSPHCWGVAFDFCRNERGREYDNADGFFNEAGRVINAMRAELGLFWGGDFKGFTDMPHAEMVRYMPDNSAAWLIKEFKTPEAFKQTWTLDKEEEKKMIVYRTYEEIPDWGKPAVRAALDSGLLLGTSEMAVDASHDLLRVLVLLYRAGLYRGQNRPILGKNI